MKSNDYQIAGALLSIPDVRDYKGVAICRANDLPEEFELGHCAVKNQGQVGSCVAHSLAECAEIFNKKESGKAEKMSTGFIYGNRRNTSYMGSGLYVNQALANMKAYGTTKAADWDVNVEVPEAIDQFEKNFDEYKDLAYQNRITSYYRLRTIDDIKACLYQGNPCVFALTFRTGMDIKDGVWIIDEKSPKTGGAHCMVIYGWNKTGWKVLNSWGTAWGKRGTVTIPYSTTLAEVWGVEDKFNAYKLNEETNKLQGEIDALKEQYNDLIIKYKKYLEIETLDNEQTKEFENIQNKLKAIEEKIDNLNKKIVEIQKDLIDVEKPFKNMDWLAKIFNAIVKFFWKIFH